MRSNGTTPARFFSCSYLNSKMCLNIKPYIVSSWVRGQSYLEKLNCVDGGPKSLKKQKKWPKNEVFWELQLLWPIFLVTLTLEKKCHILRHNITHKRVIYRFTEKKRAHFDSRKYKIFFYKNELGCPIHSKMG